MKQCTLCDGHFPEEEFAFKNKLKGIRNARCNECRRQGNRAAYYKNKDHHIKRIANNNKKHAEWFADIKSQLKCCVCGENEISCLDFHHLDPGEKDFNLSNAWQFGKQRVLNEINKCACLCSNCHRKYHAGKLFTPLVKLDIIQSYEV